MHVSSIQQPRATAAFRWFVVLCLVLVSLSAAAQVLHYHADDQLAGSAKHCSMCLVLHSTAAPAQSVQINFSFHATAYIVFWTHAGYRPASTSFSLFSRPPPLG